MGKSKKPTGLSISRDNYKFKASWKKGEKYNSDQQFEYAVITKSETIFNKAAKKAKKDNGVKGLSYTKKDVPNSKNNCDFTLTASNYYPSAKKKIKGLDCRVKGKAKKESWSDYDYKAFDIDIPGNPSIKIDWDSSHENQATIRITVPADKPHNPFKDVYYQYSIVKNFNGKQKADRYWKTDANKGVTTTSGTTTKNKDIEVKNINLDGTYTLLARCYARGMGGPSAKTPYATHSFMPPFAAKNLALTGKGLEIDKAKGIMTVNIKWTVDSDKANPIDTTTVEYYIGVPEISYTYAKTADTQINTGKNYYEYDDTTQEYYYVEEPDVDDITDYYELSISFDYPNGASFQPGSNQKDTSGEDFAKVIIPQLLALDQCLWVRVKTVHDNFPAYSNALLVKIGDLQKPTINNVVPDSSTPSTYKATVTVTNNSDVVGSFIALIYQDQYSSSNSGKIIGIIPAGQTSAQIQCPNWTGNTPISFGAYAVYGAIDWKNTKEETVIDYRITSDTEINPSKTYYILNEETHTFEKVKDPVVEDIANYREAVTLQNPMIVYSLFESMKSDRSFKGGNVPTSPTGVDLTGPSDAAAAATAGLSTESLPEGTIQVAWDVPWLEATGAEISWADHEDAWYSTNGPSTYEVDSTKQPKLNISGLEVGKIWYVRVRLYKDNPDGSRVYSLYSPIYEKDLSKAPAIPVLTLSPDGYANVDQEIKASWVYTSRDKTLQAYAEIDELVTANGTTTEKLIASTTSAQHVTFKPSDEGIEWEADSEHLLIVRVRSLSGKDSDPSTAVRMTIADPIDLQITGTSLVKVTPDEGEEFDKPEMTLQELPLVVHVSGAGDNGATMVTIKRYDNYSITRPDDSEYVGYDGETIYSESIEGEGGLDGIIITLDDLTENKTQFDDGAKYKLIVTASDTKDLTGNTGQIAEIDTIPDPNDSTADPFEYFEVAWTHQAISPELFTTECYVDIEPEDGIARIYVGKPPQTLIDKDGNVVWSFNQGDYVNIYRLSAEKPEMIYSHASFNTVYVDPYPTIGKRGGYRIAYFTSNGDYIDKDEVPAWIDIMKHVDSKFQLIGFDNKNLEFKFNVDIDNSWEKPFTLTHYLGGGIQGDWLTGVERSTTIKGNVIDDVDEDLGTYELIRALAEYNGICHVRTIEGSNYTANITVSDTSTYNQGGHPHAITLNVTRVDNPFYDAIPVEEWEAD